MPRRLRTDLAGFPLHLIQRGNNRADCFVSDTERKAYLRWLALHAGQLDIVVHAWVLMTNHVHLLVTPPAPEAVSQLMQTLGRRYVRYFNETHERSGTLWEGRYRACAVHAEGYLLACMRYIELNPVRAGLVAYPAEYRWSSCRANAFGYADPLLTRHSLYDRLGQSPAERQEAYCELLGIPVTESTLADIRSATGSGHLLATAAVRNRLESAMGLRLGPAQRGRPKRSPAA